MRSTARATAISASRALSCPTVVRSTWARPASGLSSNPTTEMSCGTRTPARMSTSMNPRAQRSLNAMTAVGSVIRRRAGGRGSRSFAFGAATVDTVRRNPQRSSRLAKSLAPLGRTGCAAAVEIGDRSDDPARPDGPPPVRRRSASSLRTASTPRTLRATDDHRQARRRGRTARGRVVRSRSAPGPHSGRRAACERPAARRDAVSHSSAARRNRATRAAR